MVKKILWRGESVLLEVLRRAALQILINVTVNVDSHQSSVIHEQGKSPDGPPLVLIKAERNAFALVGDLLDLADKVCKDFIPMAKDDKVWMRES